MALGAWIANSLLFLIEVSSFWLGSERGVRYLLLGVGNLLSGLILPLSFLPDAMQGLSRLLPFEYTLYLPVRIYLGSSGEGGLGSAIAMQLLWAVSLTILCRSILAAGVRKLVVHGG
jgi:ABC-2 type transport system permease protein